MTDRHTHTTMQQFTLVSRWVLCAVPWLLIFVLGRPVVTSAHIPDDRMPVVYCTAVVYLGQALAATLALASLRRTPAAVTATVTVLCAGQLAAVAYAADPGGWLRPQDAAFAAALTMIPMTCVWAAERWTTSLACAIASSAACVAIAPSAWRIGLAAAVAVWASAALGVRSSLWSLSVMRRLDAARQTEVDLAVVEERLRIARDLHDVLGQNLAIIAFKGELAARLAGETAPRARSELAEILRITRESQDAVHDVVRGSVSTDLAGELEGAAAVLESAGIACQIERTVDKPLASDEHEALGWVIREGVTNVIRHSRASTCTIKVASDPARVTVAISNDRALESGSGAGTGLAGLAQRLGRLGGSVSHRRDPGHTYHLTAIIPHHKE